MKRLLSMLAVLCVAGAAVTLAQPTPDLDTLFARAQRQETLAADLTGAITGYERVIEAAGPTNALTPRAMLRLAECHRKLGHDKARGIYAAIVRDYPNSGEAYDTALARLETMKAEVPAAPFQPTPFELPIPPRSVYWALAPDGRSVAYLRRAGSEQSPDSDLVLYDLATGAGRVLASHLKGITAQVRFSPDGSRVAAMVSNGGPGPSRPFRQLVVAVVNGDATAPLMLEARSSFEDAVPAWSPDGRWLAYLGPATDPNLSDARLLDAQTGTSRSLGVAVFGRQDFQWFPGGDRFAFRVADTQGATGEIHLVQLSTFAREVVAAPSAITGPMRITGATTDGRLVLLRMDAAVPNRPGRPLSATIGLFDPTDGTFSVTCQGARGGLRNPEDGSRDTCLEVTSDGTRQLYWSATTKRLMIRDLETGNERPLTVGAAEEHFGLLSPDERVQVFVSNRDGQWGVYAAALDLAPVAQPVKLTDLDSLPSWLSFRWSDSGLVLGTTGGTANLFRVDMNPETGRAIGPVVRLTQDQAWNANPAISPDGARISYWVVQGQSALAVMNADGSNERLITPRQFGYARYLTWLSNQDILFVSTLPNSTGMERLTASAATGAVSPLAVSLFQNPAWDNPASNWELRQPTGEVVYAWANDVLGPFEFRARAITTGQERTLVQIPAGCHLENFAMAPDGKTLAYQLGKCSDETKPSTIGIADLETGTIRSVVTPSDGIDIGGLSSDGRYLSVIVQSAGENYRPGIVDLATGDSWPLMPDAQQPSLWNPLMKWAPDNSFLVFMQGRQRTEWRQWMVLPYQAATGGGR